MTSADKAKAEAVLLDIWRGLNRTVFKGELLREPKFRVVLLSKKFADFRPGGRQDLIRVNTQFFDRRHRLSWEDRYWSFEELVNTLTHECIHQLQHENNLPIAHNILFKQLARELGCE